LLIATLNGVRSPWVFVFTFALLFQVSSKSPVAGIRLIDAGDRGDAMLESAKSLHVTPPSFEYDTNCFPASVRTHIITRPSFNSITPGSSSACVPPRGT
jgi:hypothetical protein